MQGDLWNNSCHFPPLVKDSVNFDFWDFDFWAISPLLGGSWSQSIASMNLKK